jgi:hypothetical protein
MPILAYSKEQIVLLYFLTHGNEWTSADDIVSWVNGDEQGKSIGVLDGRTQIPFRLSRAGAVKICKRLVPRMMDSMTTTGYKSKKVILYRLAESWSGYSAIVGRMKESLVIFLESKYGRTGIEKYLMDQVAKNNEVDFDDLRDKVVWAFQHSPTALLLGVEGDLVDLNGSEEMTSDRRLDSLMVTLACAIRVDAAVKNRGRLLNEGPEHEYLRAALIPYNHRML